MAQQLADIFLQSQNGKYAYQAEQLLIQYKAQTENYFNDVLQLLFHQNNIVSFVAATQAVNLFKKYQDIENQRLLDIVQGVLNQYQGIHSQARRHITNIMAEICAYLYFSDIYTTLPNKIVLLLRESEHNIDLFVDYYKFLEKLYTYKAGVELNDTIAQQLQNLLEQTQDIPLQTFQLIQQQQNINRKQLQLSYSAIISSAYSWEDLPDYFSDHLIETIQQILQLVQETQDNRLDLLIDENCLNVTFHIISNHSATIEDVYKNELIMCLINYLQGKISNEREHLLSRILINFNRWYISPELGEYLQETYHDQLVNATVQLLNFSENAMLNAQTADPQFIIQFSASKDDFSVNYAAEMFLTTAKQYKKNLEELLQKNINQTDPFNTFQLFRILAIKQQSIQFGIQINPQYQDFVEQYIQLMVNFDDEKILSQNYIIQGQYIKLLDFAAVIKQDLTQKLYSKILSLYLKNNNTHPFFLSLISICAYKILNQILVMKNKNQDIQAIVVYFQELVNGLYVVLFSNITQQLNHHVLLNYFSQTLTGLIKIYPQIIQQLKNLNNNILQLLKIQLADCNQEIIKHASQTLIQICKEYSPEYCFYVINQLKQMLQICQPDSLQDCFMFITQVIVLIYKNAIDQQLKGNTQLFQATMSQDMMVSYEQIQELLCQILNISISLVNHEEYPDLVQIFFLIICNLLSINMFLDVKFKHTNLQLVVGNGINGLDDIVVQHNNQNINQGDNIQLQMPQTQVSQSQMLIYVIRHGIQIQSIAASAYQCLNYLLGSQVQLDEQELANICQYNLQRISVLYNNQKLLKETCIFYGYIFLRLLNQGDIAKVHEFFQVLNYTIVEILRKIILIGCQSSFGNRDIQHKVFLCGVLIQMSIQDPQLKNMVQKCVGSLVGRVRNQNAQYLVKQEKIIQVTHTCLLDEIQNYEVKDGPNIKLSDLESQCKEALGIKSWT